MSPSKVLYYAVVRFITENGTNRSIIEFILQNRYGIYIPSYASSTEGTINKTAKRYSDFENEDLMLIISVFEEFPQALHKIPQLKYIVRRIDTEEKGMSYARPGRGSIVLAESILMRSGLYNVNDTRKIIAHEKAHFLWFYVFIVKPTINFTLARLGNLASERVYSRNCCSLKCKHIFGFYYNKQLRADWTKLGGWYQDSQSESGWSTTKERSEFVTDYAYTEDPNEDMAESIGYYFVYPDKLHSCCPEKYEFIHNRIMLMYGKRYMPSDLM